MRRLLPLLVLVACGGEVDREVSFPVGFKAHALECQIEGKLEAKLQIGGIAEPPCELEVTEDRTVTGFCAGVPTGAPRTFRLVYFIILDRMEVQLASVTAMLDLSGETRRTVQLEFSADKVNTDFDDDFDRVSNIVEVCMGRNPRLMDL